LQLSRGGEQRIKSSGGETSLSFFFSYPGDFAAGRFAKIGIPSPEIMGPFVAGVETVCGALLIIGLLTRFAAIPLLIDISMALVSTKIPILLGHGFGGFSLTKLPHYGLHQRPWRVHRDAGGVEAHEERRSHHYDWFVGGRACPGAGSCALLGHEGSREDHDEITLARLHNSVILARLRL
jgi:hypothetical protein